MVDLKGGWWMVDKGRWWMVDLKDVPHARHSEEVGGFLKDSCHLVSFIVVDRF